MLRAKSHVKPVYKYVSMIVTICLVSTVIYAVIMRHLK